MNEPSSAFSIYGDSSYELANSLEITLYPQNEGSFAVFAKPPVILFKDKRTVIAQQQPNDKEKDSTYLIQVEVDPASAEVISPDIKEKDRRDIEKLIRERILEVDHFPYAFFEGHLQPTRHGFHLNGQLTLRNRSKSIDCELWYENHAWRGEFSFYQTEFGIEPVQAFGGQLRSQDWIQASFAWFGT